MTDMDDIRKLLEKSNGIRELLEKSNDIFATALKIRELLEKLETDWGPQAADRALAIVTGDAT